MKSSVNRYACCRILTGLTTFLWLTASFAYGSQNIKTSMKYTEPEIIERIITIEGSIEKPRVIFIIPRTKVWKEDLSRKSFINDTLRPVYPGHLIRERNVVNPARR
jgi:hypothetical protein